MRSVLQAVAVLAVPGYLSLGGLHVPVYGLFAAAGLLLALLLSQRTARLAGLSRERVWDAGILAVVAAFVASRVLLVAADPGAFKRYPLLVMALPSLTYGGLLLTGLLVWGWLRWKRLPVLDVADAWAPCGALLWAMLSLGHFVEGTDSGMPTTVPWGVVTPGDTVLGRVHPVQLYAMVAGLALCAVLLRTLPRRMHAGQVAGLGMLLGGGTSFLLGMLRQPVESYGEALLDPPQWVALAAMIAGAWLWVAVRSSRYKQTPQMAVAEFLEQFVAAGGQMDVRMMKHQRSNDPLLEEIRERFFLLRTDYPSTDKEYPWCSEEGLNVLKWYAVQLRGQDNLTAGEQR